MPSNVSLKEELDLRLHEKTCDELHVLNLQQVVDSPTHSFQIINDLQMHYKEVFAKDRTDLSLILTLGKANQLGPPALDALKKGLQDHLRMLKQTETNTKQPNAVLEHDAAKRRADKLAEILRSKLIWDNTHDELQILDASDISIRYQKLVSLQQSCDILKMYSLDKSQLETFERIREEFLAWYSPATILALDSNDIKQLENMREKYSSLDRIQVFESNLGGYPKSKLKSFFESKKDELSLWNILDEIFTIWKRCHKTIDSFIAENGSEFVCKNLKEAIESNWQTILSVITTIISNAESPFIAAKSIGKILYDYTAMIEEEGDSFILFLFSELAKSIYFIISEDYGKHVTSILLCTINKIMPDKSSRHQHNWLMPYLEDIQSCMYDIVNEARSTFGTNFSRHIIPSFELAIREINSFLQNQDILNIQTNSVDIRKRKSVQENTEDKLSAICSAGYLLNMVKDVNDYIIQVTSESLGSTENLMLITKYSILETLTVKVVERKIESIANTIIYPMEDEMQKMWQKHAEELVDGSSNSKDDLSTSLPSFSVSPQNYVTGIGHGLLSQMNTISAYGNDRNFITAISCAASNGKKSFNVDEPDFWLLTEVATLVQNSFCSNIANFKKPSLKLKRQLNADIVFLMDALADLRLCPTPQLAKLADNVKEN
uniref:Conserved oligomeric Golgi complex subunit 7 n=1 Tax=Meloidogyne incognita TaxID=6306 RepID=A0A914ML91_MELIC